jgi:hypothetical protein
MQTNDLDYDVATGLLSRGDVDKPLRGTPRLIFERLAAERGGRGYGYVAFSDLRRSLEGFDGEAELCAGIKRLRELLIPLDCAIVHVEGRGYRLNVLPVKDRADRGRPDVAQRIRPPEKCEAVFGEADVQTRLTNAGMRLADVADYAADEAHRATQSTERFALKIEELMARASRGFAAAAREFAGTL